MFAVPVDVLADQSSIQNESSIQSACDDINLQITQCEVQDTLHKCDQFLSDECAWRALLGSTTLSELEDIKLDLDEKLQASEQDLLDSIEGAEKNTQYSDERWDTRYEKYQAQEASNAHMLAQCQGLKQKAKSMACKLAYDIKAENELEASQQSLLAALTKSHPTAEVDEEQRSSRRAFLKLGAARHSCVVSQRAAAEAEAALQHLRSERLSEAAPIKTATLNSAQDPRAAIWSSLCKKSKVHAKAWQNKAERAAQRCDEAEKMATQSCQDIEALMTDVDAMATEVRYAQHELYRADQQQKIIGATMFVVVFLNVMKLSGVPLPLFILHDAPAFICFAVGILIMGFVRVLVPALREHVHSSLKVLSKSSEDKIAMTDSVKLEKL